MEVEEEVKYTTDKIGHGYLPTYQELVVHYGPSASVLEIGIANGEGLEMFHDLFPYGRLVGVDNRYHARWPDNTERVVCDQASPVLPELVGGTFDIIVDDASHDNELTRKTWQNMWSSLKPGGTYVIEDWSHAGGIIRGFAGDLLDVFREGSPLVDDVESITYRPGLILVLKKE